MCVSFILFHPTSCILYSRTDSPEVLNLSPNRVVKSELRVGIAIKSVVVFCLKCISWRPANEREREREKENEKDEKVLPASGYR